MVSVDGAVQHYLTKPQLNLQVTSDKLSLPEIAQIIRESTFEWAVNGVGGWVDDELAIAAATTRDRADGEMWRGEVERALAALPEEAAPAG